MVLLNLTNPTLVRSVFVANADAVPVVKPSSLGYSNGEIRSIRKSYPMPPKPRYKRLYADISPLRASSILTDGAVIMVWLIWDLQSILGCITGKMSLLVECNTLTVLSRFGVMRNTIWYTTWCSKTYVLLASERNWISLQSQAWWFVQSTAENVAEWSFKMIFAS